MLALFLNYLAAEYEWLSALNVFRYLTFRGICGVLTSMLVCLWLGPPMIRKLNARQLGQPVRDDGPPTHHIKSGTPTMGGALILVSVVLSTLLWADPGNRFIWVILLTCAGFGFVGWADDFLKLRSNTARGIGAWAKYALQSVFGILAAAFLYYSAVTPAETALLVPFFKGVSVPLGVFYIVIAYLLIVGSSNAVNLTDGLDGLAILPAVLVTGALGIFAYAGGHAVFSAYLGIPHIPGAGEVLVFCAALVGAGLGFLWFNTYPAQVFMGDIGALSVGAALGVVALIVRQEIVFLLMAGVFVVETASVILQVASFKILGRRMFRMAPLHHHFELKGWPEPKIIVRFWIVTLILVLAGLATLKVR